MLFRSIAVAIVLFITEWQLALLSLMIVPVLVYIAATFAQRIRPLHQLVQEAWAELNVVVQENLAGSRVVRAFAQEQRSEERRVGQECRSRWSPSH